MFFLKYEGIESRRFHPLSIFHKKPLDYLLDSQAVVLYPLSIFPPKATFDRKLLSNLF
jgi:hypothetical protein